MKDNIKLKIIDNYKIIFIIFSIIMFVFPLLIQDGYILGIAVMFLIYAILTVSVNLITGFLGITSLGQAAFFGIGAYTAAILSTRYNVGFVPGAIAAILIAAIFGMIIGIPTLRIKGRYLAIVTLGFSEIIRTIELNWFELTRGPLGITSIPGIVIGDVHFDSNESKYIIGLIILGFVLYLVHSILDSRHGRAIKSIRDDELAATEMGVNVYKYKVIVFSISAGIAGIAGAFYASYIGFIDPNSFGFDQSLLILSMAILGGLGSLPGSIVGAFVLTVLPEALRSLAEYRQIIYGLILVLLMIYKPSGLMGKIDFKQLKQKKMLAEEGGSNV